ncbi:hypothetical protein Heal19_502213 [Lactiplantibacillus plantarum]|nr:hypothetical protein Heal19_502213 [Lactiplantibacillus plantarum]
MDTKIYLINAAIKAFPKKHLRAVLKLPRIARKQSEAA